MRFVGAAELRERLPMPALVRTLHEAFARGATVPPRQVLALPGGGTSLLMPAWREGGAYAVKVVNVCPANRDRDRARNACLDSISGSFIRKPPRV